jgi:hypothetical protein
VEFTKALLMLAASFDGRKEGKSRASRRSLRNKSLKRFLRPDTLDYIGSRQTTTTGKEEKKS